MSGRCKCGAIIADQDNTFRHIHINSDVVLDIDEDLCLECKEAAYSALDSEDLDYLDKFEEWED